VSSFDCQSCGACCCNTSRNIKAGFADYVEVEKTDRLFMEQKTLLKKVGVRNKDGVFHLKLVGEEQRCIALEGDLGIGVTCSIYAYRPGGCRRVEAGDDECLKARRDRDINEIQQALDILDLLDD